MRKNKDGKLKKEIRDYISFNSHISYKVNKRRGTMREVFSGTLEENIDELEYLLKTSSAGFSISRQEKQIVINHDGKMFAVISTKLKGIVNTEFIETMKFSDKWILMNDIFKFSLSVEDDNEEMDKLWDSSKV